MDRKDLLLSRTDRPSQSAPLRKAISQTVQACPHAQVTPPAIVEVTRRGTEVALRTV
jgi:hypothetical protein